MSSFSEWMRDNLLNSWQGLITQDIDWLVFDNNLESFVILEEKNSENAKVNIGQAIIFKFLNEFLLLQDIITFKGSYLVYALGNGNIYINPKLERDGNKWRYKVKNLEQPLNIENFKEFICINLEQLKNAYYRDWWNPIVNELVHNLYDCSGNPPDFPTRTERTGYRGTNLCNICSNMKKIDWIFVNYCTGYFILLEEKTYSNGNYQPNQHERDLISRIDRIFCESNAVNLESKIVRNPRSNSLYQYIGYYLLEFDNTTPGNSQNIWLNHEHISIEDLNNFLNLNSQDSLEIAERYRRDWW